VERVWNAFQPLSVHVVRNRLPRLVCFISPPSFETLWRDDMQDRLVLVDNVPIFSGLLLPRVPRVPHPVSGGLGRVGGGRRGPTLVFHHPGCLHASVSLGGWMEDIRVVSNKGLHSHPKYPVV